MACAHLERSKTAHPDINNLIDQVEKSFQDGDYLRAGILCRKAIDKYPEKNSVRSMVRKSQEWIRSYLQLCSEKLMDIGLSHYRNGDLNNAVEIWKKILIFNPQHEEAKKAVQTTTLQLKRLKSM